MNLVIKDIKNIYDGTLRIELSLNLKKDQY
jgi:hypothetical protein